MVPATRLSYRHHPIHLYDARKAVNEDRMAFNRCPSRHHEQLQKEDPLNLGQPAVRWRRPWYLLFLQG